MTIELSIALILFAFVAGAWLGAISMAKQYNANAKQVHGICRFGNPVKVIHLDFYTTNMLATYIAWNEIVNKGRPLKPGELTKGISTPGKVGNIQSDDRSEMRGGNVILGSAQQSDVHRLGGRELRVPRSEATREGDVSEGVQPPS